ncbi:amino acid adenylation domain-containing protein [Kibdelosporangium banguiense]|uniref:Amino acid adenylation domain-containing protein n=1 Tax=Kibdelosporangium banguiense TaxID=1365924 RepID=A0ABS4TX82_9PSEU|nr:amino acid adenylation domain-containing protein [Kibdelosporangium banguiense]MBP2328541.1 amino acid adenylation domain-containing protein [Kibdelosporangium banguiense]
MSTFAPAQTEFRAVTLPDGVCRRLAAVGRDCDATLDDVLLAVFQVLAGRWSGPRDLRVIGSVSGAALVLPAGLSGSVRFDELVRRVRQAGSRPARPDAALLFTPEPDGGRFGHRPEIVGPDLVESLAEGYTRLCEQIAAGCSVRLADLDVLGPQLRHDLVHGRNSTTTNYPFAEDCLHQLVERQADQCPHETAVTFGPDRLTYRELDSAANRLAHHLIALGVGPDVAVCVLLDRSIDLVVGLLAVLKAGGCYVPLEPSYPASRLAFMAAETAAPVLLTRSDLADRVPAAAWTVVTIDTDREQIAQQPSHRPASTVTPDNLAYVIYTSGSTGTPKGVMALHRGVVHYLAWCGWKYRAHEGTGAPVHSPVSFDLTVTGLFLPLVYGRTVTLIPEDEHPVVGLSDRLADDADYTFVKLTPGHLPLLAQCVSESATTAAAGARWLVVGGEQLTAEQLAFWRENAPHVMVANEYGHTETSVACVMECRPAGELTSSPVSIGRPFWNTQLYVVDEELSLVPPGVPGECLTGGIGVTRGYWNRPALTAEKFIPNPFGTGRVYRSGDVVRYLPDGRLEFVARLDRQLKVRGFRVEPGEIEARVMAYPGVRQAVVAIRQDHRETPRLTAYVESAQPVSTKELGAFVRELLPEYMVPESVITLDTFPLTPNGKIDHSRLAGLDLVR